RRANAALCRLGCGNLQDGVARHRVGDAQAASEVHEHLAHLVEDPDHFGTRVDDALEVPPLPDEAEGVVPGSYEPSSAKTLERPPHVTVRLQKSLRLTRFHAKAVDVECCHLVILSSMRRFPGDD